jgi:hypothetical protein
MDEEEELDGDGDGDGDGDERRVVSATEADTGGG